jgi:branched-chain amino acid transport system ATP-binding protein
MVDPVPADPGPADAVTADAVTAEAGPTEPVTASGPLLEAIGISKQFGGIQALSELSFDVGRGEAVGIVGPNGAGKTTLFNCLLGLVALDTGTVAFDGVRIDRLPVWKRSRMGIGRTYQRMELFSGMTVADHLLVAEQAKDSSFRLWRDLLHRGGPTAAELRHVEEVLELLGLDDVANRPVDGLDLGHARLVEVGRALMGAPRLLMLDEPSSGLDAAETERLASVLDDVRGAQGTSVVLVEHDLHLVETLVDRLFVLNFGRMLASGPVEEVMASPEVRLAYLGTSG